MYGVSGATDLISFGHLVQTDWVFIVNSDREVESRMKNQLIVMEERERIANELHDSVSQRLFGIVCALHSLQAKNRGMTTDELNEELQFLSQSANTTLKELRATIYRLCSSENNEVSLFIRLQTFFDDYARLQTIQIDAQLKGDESSLSDELKEAIYRIICEACGNAVRHGQCSVIAIKLSLLEEKTVLKIQDNGSGIDLQMYEHLQFKGIGLLNMQRLTTNFSGTFSIGSEQGTGTEILIEIPIAKIPEKV